MSISPDDLARLVAARKNRPQFHAFAADRRPRDEAEGYKFQDLVRDALADAGIKRAAYKIASTSVEGQRALGLSEPAYAGMYDDVQAPTLRAALDRPLREPKVECEIAFVTRTELGGASNLSDDALRDAIASAHLACEIVDNRYGVPLDVGIPTILTDDFFNAAFALGPSQAGWQDLLRTDRAGFIEIDGEVVKGSTADVLRPFEALRWLVGKLARHGKTLGAGEIVLTGSLVVPTPIKLPARSVSIGVDGFGTLTLAD
ncbi:hypothetical protein G3545_16290 [Starkeya sp. ORNL1]|uniref:2-keto-4-pentenoate hydratase n=1 Tax=Starkeya sp. ORNL1 TaxID=2709380 RepID=UPI001464877B|nr:hypothetical protein [Starkeya sp. ORNL1]QJP15067.1 hypothetical protein G3545_16290 [Starkeya sp. ORNL1]